MTPVLFMWSNLIRTVFLVLGVYEECLFRVYLALCQTDARNNYLMFWCCELGIKNRAHNFLTWTRENVRIFPWQDTNLIFSPLLFIYLYCSLSLHLEIIVATEHHLQTQRKTLLFKFHYLLLYPLGLFKDKKPQPL